MGAHSEEHEVPYWLQALNHRPGSTCASREDLQKGRYPCPPEGGALVFHVCSLPSWRHRLQAIVDVGLSSSVHFSEEGKPFRCFLLSLNVKI